MDSDLRDLMTKMLEVNVKDRITPRAALDHRFFKDKSAKSSPTPSQLQLDDTNNQYVQLEMVKLKDSVGSFMTRKLMF